MIMTKRWKILSRTAGAICILYTFCTLLPAFSTLSGKETNVNVFTEYKNALRNLKKIYGEIRKRNEQADAIRQQRREQLKFERELSTDRERERRKRNAPQKFKYANKEEIFKLRKALAYNLDRFIVSSRILQDFLNKHGTGGGYDFPFYAKELTKIFPTSGIKLKEAPRGKGTVVLQPIMNPDQVFLFIEADMENLKTACFSPESTPPFAPEYIKFNTFFRFYEALDYYRTATRNFNRPPEDYSSRCELDRRVKRLQKAAADLHRLLLRNSPEAAHAMKLPEMAGQIEKIHKTSVSAPEGFLANVQFFGSSVQKSHAAMTPGDKFKEKWKTQLRLLNAIADGLRGKMTSKKQASLKNKKNRPLPRWTPFFADHLEKVLPDTMRSSNAASPDASKMGKAPAAQETGKGCSGKPGAEKPMLKEKTIQKIPDRNENSGVKDISGMEQDIWE